MGAGVSGGVRWVEIDACIRTLDPGELRSVVLDLVAPLADEFKRAAGEGGSWHFLWEDVPCPRGDGDEQQECPSTPKLRECQLTLRLRFHGDAAAIEHVKRVFEGLWRQLEGKKPGVYCDFFCYGRHGKCCKEYAGEEDTYGPEGWRLVERMLNFGSEVALELARNYENMGPDKAFKGQPYLYADRYVHLFLDQVSPLIRRGFELDFYLSQFVWRYFTAALGVDLNGLPEPARGEALRAISETMMEVALLAAQRAEALRRSLRLAP